MVNVQYKPDPSGDEELKLKRRRDISHSKYSDFKKRLTCSTEALEQIAQITKATSFSPSMGVSDKVNNGSKQ